MSLATFNTSEGWPSGAWRGVSISLRAGQVINVEASGEITIDGEDIRMRPDDANELFSTFECVLPGAPRRSLIAKIGWAYFVIGSQTKITVPFNTDTVWFKMNLGSREKLEKLDGAWTIKISLDEGGRDPTTSREGSPIPVQLTGVYEIHDSIDTMASGGGGLGDTGDYVIIQNAPSGSGFYMFGNSRSNAKPRFTDIRWNGAVLDFKCFRAAEPETRGGEWKEISMHECSLTPSGIEWSGISSLSERTIAREGYTYFDEDSKKRRIVFKRPGS